jgi:thiamine biosynthesis lipoprotein
MGLAFEEADRLVALLSRFDCSTPVSELNRAGRLADVPPEVGAVVESSLHYHRLTGGVFDITVQPVVDFYRRMADRGQLREPTESELAGLLARVGAEKLRRGPDGMAFAAPGMGITLDGIACGYIVDRASELLNRQGIRNHLVNASGDIRLRGLGENGKPWAVAIQDPWKRGQYPDRVHVTDGAISTSGDYEIYYDQEKMFHHIVDPRSGRSPDVATSASVRAATCMEADALATTLLVMGTRRGTDFINSVPGCQSLVIGRDGSLWKSDGWGAAA